MNIKRIIVATVAGVVSLPAMAASVSGYGQSVFLSPVSANSYGIPVVMNFTTSDGRTDVSPLRQTISGGYLYSGELRPKIGGGGIYETDFITVKVSDGSTAEYGSLEISLPVTDSDANGLPDFAQQDMSCNISTTGVAKTDFSSVPPAQSRNVLITMNRNSGSKSGTYTVKDQATGGSTINFSGSWEINTFSGSMAYDRGSQNLASFAIQRFNSRSGTVRTFTGATVFTVDSENQLTFPQFHVTDTSDGSVYTIGGTILTRSGNKYSGSIAFTDGDLSTTWNDYTSWQVEIADASDIDGDGVPDLSDTAYANAPSSNKVLSLDGSNSYVKVANSTSLHSATELTLEAWVYPESAPANQSQYFISKGDGGSVTSDRSYHINWKPVTTASPGFNVEMFFNQNNYAYVIVPAAERKWVHIALTFNSSDGVMKFYTNGVLAAQQTKDSSNGPLLGQTIRQSSKDLVFGNLLAPPASGKYAKGYLDEVRIWGVSKDKDGILLTMQSRLSGNEPNLLAYWNFDAGILTDVSGNGHEGLSYGNAVINLISGNNEVHAARIKSVIRNANGTALLSINLATNLPHTVLASPNLQDWTMVTNIVATSSPFEVTDPYSTNSPVRFYQLTSP